MSAIVGWFLMALGLLFLTIVFIEIGSAVGIALAVVTWAGKWAALWRGFTLMDKKFQPATAD